MGSSSSVTAPWRRLYGDRVCPIPRLPEATVLDLFRGHVEADGDACALRYFGRDISRRDLDWFSDELARALSGHGVTRGERVAVAVQNTPVFVAVTLATWKLGAVLVPVNPMLRPRELAHLLSDCTPKVLVAHPDLQPVVRHAVTDTASRPKTVVWSSPSELAGDLAAPWSGTDQPEPDLGVSLTDLLDASDDAPEVTWQVPGPADLALITYTSGTTGPAKGAMSTHANLTYQALVSGDWFGLSSGESVLSTAPLFHITGLGLHMAVALGAGVPLVLTYRFHAPTVLQLLRTYTPTVTVGAITAFISLADHVTPGDPSLAALRTSFSGGAPVPQQVVQRYADAFGVYIHNIYGLTETTSACTAVPYGAAAPVDPASGALSVGVPLPLTEVHIVDDHGSPVPPGISGEIVISGPGVGAGYWRRPEETAHAFRDDGLRTGDVGVMDERGWVFVVDRKKDLLVVSGYKVWPREVEDVLYLHPAVLEAAVVGRPDDYQGESVVAFVTVRDGRGVDADELERHCRAYLSAYKVPREVVFLPELPKTATGKILRRHLRAQRPAADAAS